MWEEVRDFSSANEFIEYISSYHSHYEVKFFSTRASKCIGGKVMNGDEYGKFL